MSEKRYIGYEDGDYWNVIKDTVDDKILDDAYEIADRLNKLYEENEQLKQQLTDCKDKFNHLITYGVRE